MPNKSLMHTKYSINIFVLEKQKLDSKIREI